MKQFKLTIADRLGNRDFDLVKSVKEAKTEVQVYASLNELEPRYLGGSTWKLVCVKTGKVEAAAHVEEIAA